MQLPSTWRSFSAPASVPCLPRTQLCPHFRLRCKRDPNGQVQTGRGLCPAAPEKYTAPLSGVPATVFPLLSVGGAMNAGNGKCSGLPVGAIEARGGKYLHLLQGHHRRAVEQIMAHSGHTWMCQAQHRHVPNLVIEMERTTPNNPCTSVKSPESHYPFL